jgi:hypothetical protein
MEKNRYERGEDIFIVIVEVVLALAKGIKKLRKLF